MSTDLVTTSSLTRLEHLHEASLLQALHERYTHDEIYTWIGDILVAVNPLKPLPSLYSDAKLDTYTQTLTSSSTRSPVPKETGGVPPHIFAIGDKAFRGLVHAATRRNQTILVSGESGSGKTESTKFLMQYLTRVGQDDATVPSVPLTDASTVIGRRILQTNPILEAFGNAQTMRNDNSSRFGRFLQLHFGSTPHHHTLVGAHVHSYLLEKVRVVHHRPPERNFHIFYQLLAGADAPRLASLGLVRGAPYTLVHASTDRATDAQRYHETIQALHETGVSAHEQTALLQVVAAIVHLGNVTFTPRAHERRLDVAHTAREHLEHAAALVGVPVDALETLLTCRTLTAGLDAMVLFHDPTQATETCHALAQALYGQLFTWLVQRLSDAINAADKDVEYDSDKVATIGILDIFGFESLARNGFEQLCINYANERLQAQLNDFVFHREQRVYEAEHLAWTSMAYPSNAACLALFDDKTTGLFALLDEECLLPKGSNPALCTKFYRYHGRKSTSGSSRDARPRRPSSGKSVETQHHHDDDNDDDAAPATTFSASKLERVNHQFVVHHFAGRVCYHVEQFLEKNTDAVPADVSALLSRSTNPVVLAMQGADTTVSSSSSGRAVPEAGRRRRYSMLRAPSVSAQLKTQLDRLIDQIGRTEAHYVRCLKPNERKQPGLFDRQRMVEQMRSVGLLEAVRIARHGYSARLAHATFLDQFAEFKWFLSVQDRSKGERDTAQALVAVVLDKLLDERGGTAGKDLCRTDVQVGKTLVFFKSSAYNWFTQYRLEVRTQRATQIQQAFRGYRHRRHFQRLRGTIVHMQAIGRRFLAQTRVHHMRQVRRASAASRLQTWWHTVRVQRTKRLQRQVDACLILQRFCRRVVAQRGVHAARTERLWTARIQRCRLRHAFRRFQRACQASQAAREIEAELSPRATMDVASSKWHGPDASLSEKPSSDPDEQLAPPLPIITPSGRQRPRASRPPAHEPSQRDVDARNALLEHEILRLQQLLVEQQSDRPLRRSSFHSPARRTDARRPARRAAHGHHHHQALRRGTILDDDDDEEDDDGTAALPPRRVQSFGRRGPMSDPVSMLSHKIQELDAKCKFLEQLVVHRTTDDASCASSSRDRVSSLDYSDVDTASDVDAILSNIQTQMHLLRASVADKHARIPRSRSARTLSYHVRPARSCSTVSTSVSHTAPSDRVPSLPLSASQLSTGDGSSSRRSSPTSSSSCMFSSASLHLTPRRSAPAHFGGRGVPRIVKWARATHCYECHAPFNLFVRRHHCRMCGNSFCHEHSSRRVAVVGIGFDDAPVRVCDTCFADYYAPEPETCLTPASSLSSSSLLASLRRSGVETQRACS
ncbi:hypothetical protein PsorP6_009382 [Peronosclerospora sorghi]|uniref:Uncharacterized protein n=1 Tax=Peronosclerospora sorghi TaxID=230839 RepID=A0ACC0VZM2_9STRA|nr:hypothetical protein PsorP6_009382 [Peronosclerospora sorghi]